MAPYLACSGRAPTRRASSSEASSAPIEITTEIRVRRIAPASPPGTAVLAEVPDLLGPGRTAQMTYYETAAGAKVFAAGTLDFGGSVLRDPQDRMLQNLWAWLSAP